MKCIYKKVFLVLAIANLMLYGCEDNTTLSVSKPEIGNSGQTPAQLSQPALEDIIINYNADYDSGEAYVKWGAALFSESNYEYNNEIARVSAAIMAAASEGQEDLGQARFLVPALSTALGFEDISLFSYNHYSMEDSSVTKESLGSGTDDYAFAIAHQKMQDAHGQYELVIISCRGTVTNNEAIWADFFGTLTTFAVDNWCGHKTYDSFASYANKVLTGLALYQKKHSQVFDGDVRYLITGHSLGGAAAQLVAAELTQKNEVVYAYTFGALNSIIDNATQSYKNIWNIFNYYDDFGPNGSGDQMLGYSPAGGEQTIYNKFGNVLLFDRDYTNVFTCNKDYKNHVMPGYYQAINDGIVKIDAVYEDMKNGNSEEDEDLSQLPFQIVDRWVQIYGSGDWENYNGRVISFTDRGTCNLWSPDDAYYITGYSEEGFTLNITGAIGGTPKYTVKIINEDYMEMYLDSTLTFQLERYSLEPQTAQENACDFVLLGDWTQTYGKGSWAAYNGRTITFSSDGYCALWSPLDSYSMSVVSDNQFVLSITGVLGGNPQYTVKIIDNDTLEIYLGSDVEFELSRQ